MKFGIPDPLSLDKILKAKGTTIEIKLLTREKLFGKVSQNVCHPKLPQPGAWGSHNKMSHFWQKIVRQKSLSLANRVHGSLTQVVVIIWISF